MKSVTQVFSDTVNAILTDFAESTISLTFSYLHIFTYLRVGFFVVVVVVVVVFVFFLTLIAFLILTFCFHFG